MRQRLAVVVGLFALLTAIVLLLPPGDERQPPLTVYSATPSGGRALRLWLEALGRQVTTLEGNRYAVGEDVGTILVLAPTRTVDRDSAATLERWTRRGGRLVVADASFRSAELLRRFDVTLGLAGDDLVAAVPARAGRLDPAIFALTIETRTEVRLGGSVRDATPLLIGRAAPSPNGQPAQERPAPPIVAVRVPVERGELVVLSAPDLLSNAGLRDEQQARLALALVGMTRADAVAFDEHHHGYGAIGNRSLFSLLLEQAWGRTAILASVLVLLFLIWRGRRFGRSVPVFVDRGRALGELVTSQAALLRAGGKRAFAAEHLARKLRQDVAGSLGLPADAPDEQIAARAGSLGRDPSTALRALARVHRARTDRELLALARTDLALRPRERRAGAAPAAPDRA